MDKHRFQGYKTGGEQLYSTSLLSPWILHNNKYHRLRLSLDGGIYLEVSGEAEKSIGHLIVSRTVDCWLLPDHVYWKGEVSRLLNVDKGFNRGLIMSHVRLRPKRKKRQKHGCHIPEDVYAIEEWVHQQSGVEDSGLI